MPLVQLVTIAAGGVLGLLFALIWNSVARRQGPDDFWPSFARIAQSLVAGDDDEAFLDQYWTLLKSLGLYVGRMLLRVTLAALPIVLTLTLVMPLAARSLGDEAARGLEWTLFIAIGGASVIAMFLLKRRRP